MAKSSGSTRASSSNSPRGLSNTVEENNSMAINAIERAGFKSVGGNGNWELDTPYGGAQILDETRADGETFGYKEYGVSVWDKDYEMIENGQAQGAKRFATLNEAKRYAKDLLKEQYSK